MSEGLGRTFLTTFPFICDPGLPGDLPEGAGVGEGVVLLPGAAAEAGG